MRVTGLVMIMSVSQSYIQAEFWNIPEGIVTGIKFTFENNVSVKNLNFNLSRFKKTDYDIFADDEEDEEEYPDYYAYYDEASGIFIRLIKDNVNEVVFHPPKSKNGRLCDNDNAKLIRSGEIPYAPRLYYACILYNLLPTLNEVTLDKTEIVGCSEEAVRDGKCPDGDPEISVRTDATDPENDPLTYIYEVSAGKIIGQGWGVVWDLTGVPAGVYTITVTVDDGSGPQQSQTKTVVVR